jgi:hypothetical protein
VSSRAIHRLPTENKRRRYRGIYRLDALEGCFFNLDVVGPSDEYLRERYRAARDYVNGPAVPSTQPRASRTSAHGHFPESVASHLALLADAGIAPVDCFWKQLGNAPVGGYRHS